MGSNPAGPAIFALVLLCLPAVVSGSGPVTWADFVSSPPQVGVATTVSLGGGSSVDVIVNTGGTQGLSSYDFGAIGAPETGLDYTHLLVFGIFNGGGTSTVPTTIQFSGFQVGADHVSGYLFVGAVNGFSSPITVTSSVPGAVSTWPQTGITFDLDADNSWPISWNPPSGTFATDAPVGIDSDGIVIEVSNLSQYTTITLSLLQYLNDGIVFSIGEGVGNLTGVPAFQSMSWGRLKDLYR